MQEKKEINAFVDSWGLKEISFNGQNLLKVSIRFNDKDGNSFFFDKFLLKKDGTPNKNTISAIRACGFKSNDFTEFVDADALTKGKQVSLTIVKNDKGYDDVEFVNDLGGVKRVMAVEEAKGKLSQSLASLNSALASSPASDDEEIPF